MHMCPTLWISTLLTVSKVESTVNKVERTCDFLSPTHSAFSDNVKFVK